MNDAESRYWVLRPPLAERKLAVWAKDEVDVLTKNCSVNPAHTRIGPRTPGLSVILPDPPARELIWTWYSELLIQDSVATAFQREDFKKFELAEAKARFRASSQKPTKVWEFLPRGWGGMAKPESGIRLLEHCEHCGRTMYSALTHPENLIDPLQWDGSDIFVVWPLPKFIFVTDRVCQFISANNLRDVTLTPVARLEVPPIDFSVDMTDFVRERLGYPWCAPERKSAG